MKFKMKVKKAVGVVSLVAEGDKGDELNYVDAERLQRGDLASFIPFTYEKKGKSYRITYEVNGLICFSDLVKDPFAPMQLRTLLLSFLRLMKDCEENGLMRQRVAIDVDRILYDCAAQRLRFVYVPLQSFVSSSTGMNGALSFLCEHAQVSYDELSLRDAALDYARRTAVITNVEFGEFLQNLGLVSLVPAVGKVSDASPGFTTDRLGDKSRHGLDFVSSQLQKAEDDSTRQRNPEESSARGFALTRLSNKVSWRLGEGKSIVGRTDACQIILNDVCGLSRQHAEFKVTGNSCTVRDLESTNGVLVNGCRMGLGFDVLLKRGDIIKLGDEEFEIR